MSTVISLMENHRRRGLLKAKLAKLRRELLTSAGTSGGGGGGPGFDVARTGIASVGFVGHVVSS
ncbi:hypothetical protein FRC19_004862 [Serendipita sp. 401]|nr:hypothetical protein FRC19_004862 [Serendipita sp. 401]